MDPTTTQQTPVFSANPADIASGKNQTPSGTGSSSLIVTSNASRSQYADNVNKMNTAISGVSSSPGSYKGVAIQAGDDTSIKTQIAKIDADAKAKADATQKTDTTTTDPNAKKTTDTTTDGTTKSGVDPFIQKQIDTANVNLDAGITSAKATLDAATSTLANDAAAKSAVDAIRAKYDQQIQLMKDKNTLLAGSYKTNSARTGMTQYANEMDTNFMSEEQDRASQRVADLITQEQIMINKTYQAFKTGDVKALNDAQTAYDKANKEKVDSINKLLIESDKVVKAKAAEVKTAKLDAKQEITDNIRISNSLATVVANSLKASAITDPKKRRAYIEQMATAGGITNPDILESAVVKAEQTQKRQDILNTKSTKTGGGKGGVKSYSNFSSKPTPATVTKVNAYIQSIGGNQAAIDAANGDEETFYKVLNSIPKKNGSTDSGTTPP